MVAEVEKALSQQMTHLNKAHDFALRYFDLLCDRKIPCLTALNGLYCL